MYTAPGFFPGIHIIRWGPYLTIIRITRSAQMLAHITQKMLLSTFMFVTLPAEMRNGWMKHRGWTDWMDLRVGEV